MSELLDVGILEKSRNAFDSMKPAKNRIDGFRVAGILLESEQLVFDSGEMLSRFENEVRNQLRILIEGRGRGRSEQLLHAGDNGAHSLRRGGAIELNGNNGDGRQSRSLGLPHDLAGEWLNLFGRGAVAKGYLKG